jgi:hypothetical protein
MLFHADRNVKENLFNMYKKDALDHMAKKSEIKMQIKNEEREYMENFNRKIQQEDDKKNLEKQHKINERMNEYNLMCNMKGDPRIKRNKYEDVKLNYYGVNVVPNENNLGNLITNMNNPLNNNNYSEKEFNLNKKYAVTPQTDQIKHIVSHENNNQEKEEYNTRIQKVEQQKLYKEFLDSQVKYFNYTDKPKTNEWP